MGDRPQEDDITAPGTDDLRRYQHLALVLQELPGTDHTRSPVELWLLSAANQAGATHRDTRSGPGEVTRDASGEDTPRAPWRNGGRG